MSDKDLDYFKNMGNAEAPKKYMPHEFREIPSPKSKQAYEPSGSGNRARGNSAGAASGSKAGAAASSRKGKAPSNVGTSSASRAGGGASSASRTAASRAGEKRGASSEHRSKTAQKSAPPQNSRQPKGRDTRNIPLSSNEIKPQKEKLSPKQLKKQEKRKRKMAVEILKEKRKAEKTQARRDERVNASNKRYNSNRDDGISTDEITAAWLIKKKKKRTTAIILSALSVVVVGILLVGFFIYNNVLVEGIVIEGESPYSDEEIIVAAEIAVGDSMFSFSSSKINEKVTAALPYVHAVELQKDTETVTLNVTQTKEALLIKNGSGFFCVDENDKILLLKKKKLTSDMYRINGLEEQEVLLCDTYTPNESNTQKYAVAKQLAEIMSSTGVFKKCVIDVSDLTNVVAVYDSRVKLYFGDCTSDTALTQIKSKFPSAAEVMRKNIPDGQEGYLLLYIDKQIIANTGTLK